jgi:hypothetical protein
MSLAGYMFRSADRIFVLRQMTGNRTSQIRRVPKYHRPTSVETAVNLNDLHDSTWLARWTGANAGRCDMCEVYWLDREWEVGPTSNQCTGCTASLSCGKIHSGVASLSSWSRKVARDGDGDGGIVGRISWLFRGWPQD